MIQDDRGEWRGLPALKAMELVAPSDEWLELVNADPDAARLYAEAQAKAAEAEPES